MKKFMTIAKCSLQVTITYPINLLLQIIVNLIVLILLLNLWKSVFIGNVSVVGYNWEEISIYLIIVFIINTDVNSEYRCAKRIIDGSIAMTLIKPISYSKYTTIEIGTAVVVTFILNLIIGSIFSTFLNTFTQYNLLTLFLFIISLINAVIIKYLIIFLSSLASFWTHNVQGVMWTRIALVNLFSGALIPLEFFPAFLRRICEVLPFKTIIYVPTQIYLSKINHYEMVEAIFVQFLWIIIFFLFSKFVFYYGIKKVNIYGG